MPSRILLPLSVPECSAMRSRDKAPVQSSRVSTLSHKAGTKPRGVCDGWQARAAMATAAGGGGVPAPGAPTVTRRRSQVSLVV
jgi:hypothetical protein